VILVGRSDDRGRDTLEEIQRVGGGANAEFIRADLSSQAEVRRLAATILERFPRLDVLVNNAGGIFRDRLASVDGIEMTFALNHLSYFLLTNLLLPLLRQSAPARIVNVASQAHNRVSLDLDADASPRTEPYRFIRAYRRSKLANLLFTYELARRLTGSGVTVNALHPGYVRTNIFALNGVAGWFLRRAADVFAISAEQGADTSLFLAGSPEVEGVSGRYFYRRKPVVSSPPSRDETLARQLWQVSETLTGLSGQSTLAPES
jgi:NAD(P)-dependent dehydrogenase (short-subunit alcohol dehydrogenase family)